MFGAHVSSCWEQVVHIDDVVCQALNECDDPSPGDDIPGGFLDDLL
jgi:hypothetical protein